jgi:coenzyme F420-dependent glucose-6-phosphate dehydrogenase
MRVSYDMGAVGHWFEPAYCIELAQDAEKAGFDVIWMGDHFLPWFHTHAHSPQAWVWIAAAAQKTSSVNIGSGATAPMFKYHPGVVAQAFATLGNLYPGRIELIVGTGEALNEGPFIDAWPRWQVRADMLVEAVELMRRFWSSEDYFTHAGKYFSLKNVLCYDKPGEPIPVYFSAYGPKAANVAGKHGDGLVTWGLKFDYTRKEIVPNFERGAISVGRDPSRLPKLAWVDCGLGEPKRLLEKFRNSSAAWFIPANYDEPNPRKTELNAQKLTDDEITKMALLTEEPKDFLDVIERSREEGMDHVIFSDSSFDPKTTIGAFGKHVIPRVKKRE